VVALGSVLGTLADAVDSVRADGIRAGVLGITAYRPFPFEQVRQALRKVRRVVVMERAFAVGVGGIVSADVYSATRTPPWTVVAGLGGRPVTAGSLRGMLRDAATDRLKPLTFLDLDHDRVRRELRAVGGAR
jgi:pyruvate ferredoxin oxidoreductase alpha subunit